MIKIGAITVGQSPRPDITCDVINVLGEGFEVVEAGVWDGVTKEEIEKKYGPEEGKDVLPTRLSDGSNVSYAEYHSFPRIQKCVEMLEAQGVSLIYMYCLSSFPKMNNKVPLIYPREITLGVVKALLVNSSMIELMPDKNISEQQIRFWGPHVNDLQLLVANPHGKNIWNELDEVAEFANHGKADLILMDCMGYSLEHLRYLKAKTDKRVLLPRTVVAGIIREFLRT
jgi:protein AroM